MSESVTDVSLLTPYECIFGFTVLSSHNVTVNKKKKRVTHLCEDDAADLQDGHISLLTLALLPNNGAHTVFRRVAGLKP